MMMKAIYKMIETMATEAMDEKLIVDHHYYRDGHIRFVLVDEIMDSTFETDFTWLTEGYVAWTGLISTMCEGYRNQMRLI